MSSTYQQFYDVYNIRADDLQSTNAMEASIPMIAGKVTDATFRFALPRSADAGAGSTLLSVALNYRISAGGANCMASVVPSLTRYVEQNGVLQSTSAIAVTTAPAAVLSQDTLTTKLVSTVDTPAIDNQAATQTISYLYTVRFTATTACTVLIQGAVTSYSFDSAPTPADSVSINSNTTLDKSNSGSWHVIDASGGAIVLTLPKANNVAPNSNVNTVFNIKCGVAGNQISISPNALDYVNGLGLNAGSTVDKDFILATPAVGDYISIITDGVNAWQVVNASGTWTREA